MHKDCILFPCETVEQENCCIRDCGRYKIDINKMNQIKKASFKKRIEWIAKCTVCGEQIRWHKWPELSSQVHCSECDTWLEVMSTNNYRGKE